MESSTAHLWAKTSKAVPAAWHPLLLHLIDVALCAESILHREPRATRDQFAQALGLSWEETGQGLVPSGAGGNDRACWLICGHL